MELSELLATFLLAFPALFSIVNPVAGAFVFNEATAGRDDAGMARLAGLVARNSASAWRRCASPAGWCCRPSPGGC
jgi:multiple antibiotic resistance protein